MNHHNAAPVDPAKFANFLATIKSPFSNGLASEFVTIKATADRLSKEREKYSRGQARKAFDRLRDAANENPSEANTAALLASSLSEMERSFDQKNEELASLQQATRKKAQPTWRKIGEAVIPIVEAEIERAESERRNACEKYGVPYDQADDHVLRALIRYRDLVRDQLTVERPVPVDADQVVALVGEIRGR